MNKEKIIIQTVVTPLEETFSQELPRMMSASEKLRSKLLAKNLDVSQPQSKKVDKTVDQTKLVKKMGRLVRTANLNSANNSRAQRELLNKLIRMTTSAIWESTLIGWADSRTEEVLSGLVSQMASNHKKKMHGKKSLADIIEDNKNDVSDIVSGKTNVTISQKKLQNSENTNRNPAVWDILKAGSDFLQNFFEVEFIFRDRDETKRKDNKFQRLMYTRVGSIEIPRLKNKTFSIKTATGSVPKIAAKFEGGYETTLSIRPDQDCYIVDKLNEIGGNYEFSEPKVFAPSAIFNEDTIGSTKSHRLDIAVKDISNFEHDYGGTVSYSIHSKGLSSSDDAVAVNSSDVNLNNIRVSEWHLEDVRIVGINDIEFSPDTTSPPNVQLQIIAKMVSHSYYTKLSPSGYDKVESSSSPAYG